MSPARPQPGQPQYGPPPGQAPYAPPPAAYPPPPRRRRRGTCLGCLAVLVALGVLIGGAILALVLIQPRSRNLTLGARSVLLSDRVSPAGGALVVQSPGNPLDGLRLTVPPGAYEDEMGFDLSTRPIEAHRFGPDFNPITPLIQVDNGERFAKEPLTIEIPIQIAPHEFAMAFYYDRRSGTLEGLPLIGLTGDKLTLLTSHFSDIVVSKVDRATLQSADIETGFVPGVDDWQFRNYGSVAAPHGHCAGQSISAMWYYYEERLQKKPALYGHFDNNAYDTGTPDFWWDDSWGYRWASTVQRTVDWDARTRTLFTYAGALDDQITWLSFAYAMHITREPQYVAVGRYYMEDGKERRGGHAVVAYKIEQDAIYVADPNFPGRTDQVIPFAGGVFAPYLSGANAAEIEESGPTEYPEIRYMAKSALVDWEQVRGQYADMRANKAGQGVFPPYTLSVATGVDEEGNKIWVEFPELLELDEEGTAKLGEDYRGKIPLKITMAPGTHLALNAYKGTKPVGQIEKQDGIIEANLRLDPGVNHVGLLVRSEDWEGNLDYNDFWRIKVIYGPQDLSGRWEGTMRVEEVTNLRQYVEDLVVRFLLLTRLTESEAKARQVAAEAVTEAPGLRDDRPYAVILERPDPKQPQAYRARVYLVNNEGGQQEYTTDARYEKGVLTFTAQGGDGSAFHYRGELSGENHLTGTFTLSVWGVIKHAGSGVWEATREE